MIAMPIALVGTVANVVEFLAPVKVKIALGKLGGSKGG